jgi:release factor glutamine methyltransferase
MSSAEQTGTAWTVGKLLEWTTRWFGEKDVEGGRFAAELLLAHAMGCRKIELYTRFDVEPAEEQRTRFRELVAQAGEHVPIAYLLGYREFFSLDFEVTPAVLVPRPETEAIVQRVLELCRASAERTWDVLDIGTGSGCIAVAIAKYADNAHVVASDISAEALEVATRNIARYEVGDRVAPVEADCVALPAETIPEGGFDVVVSNPPYISEEHWPTLPPNVREHEPQIALLAGPGGLDMYRRLAAEVPRVLKKEGRLLVEIGFDQHEAVKELFTSTGSWTYLATHRDPTDPHDRVIEFQCGLDQR